jgi:GNAT superfamily N-acetyltransferase
MSSFTILVELSHIRNPIISDKEKILSFCQNTFSWGDYIEEVYDSWITEGELAILEENNTPIGMCHGVPYIDEGMIWIEGIRVRDDYRRNGFAEKMVQHIERNAKNSGIKHASMIIESGNKPSLNLAEKIGYSTQKRWNYFSLVAKKNPINVEFDHVTFDELNHRLMHYVDSWRWIPITRLNFERLDSKNNILCIKNNEEIQSLGIISETISFNDTIILTIIFGVDDDVKRMIHHVQNFAAEKNYTKIRILTEQDSLPSIDDLGEKFSFYLLKKNL